MTEAIKAIKEGQQVLFCCSTYDELRFVSVASTVFQTSLVSYLASSLTLGNRITYPYLSLLVPINTNEAEAVSDVILYLYEQTKIPKYLQVNILCTTDAYGLSAAYHLVQTAPSRGINIVNFQQFLRATEDISVELTSLSKSTAKIFVCITDDVDSYNIVRKAGAYGLIGPNNIWFCLTGCATPYTILNSNYEVDPFAASQTVGMIGIQQRGFEDNEVYRTFEALWKGLDPDYYYYAGPDTSPDIYSQYTFDGLLFIATAYDTLIKENQINVDGTLKNTTRFNEVLSELNVLGCTGNITLDRDRNRYPSYQVLNFQPGDVDFTKVGVWNPVTGAEIDSPIYFFDETTNYPDIDIQPPFAYWSCENKQREVDLTGKTIKLDSPKEKNPNLNMNYHCDQFIDCYNISDESVDCETNYVIVYIVFSIITFVLILIAILFIIFTIVFGIVLKKRNLRAASPSFLIVICISCIVGYSSIYAWYGKPNAVACGFQPWLLGLSVVSMVSALCSKTFRIWRIFKFPMQKKVITDFELFIFWFIMIVPAVFILFLWTLVSTPTTVLKSIDGEKHLVCDTGGFTGPPGGYVFFFILVGYEGFVLLIGGFLSIATRKVPSLYNESNLIAICIYNLVFLSVIVIPVVIVLNTMDPFVSWIIRTLGILYAFTATLWLQFIPKIFGVLRRKDILSVVELSNLELSDRSRNVFGDIPEAPASMVM